MIGTRGRPLRRATRSTVHNLTPVQPIEKTRKSPRRKQQQPSTTTLQVPAVNTRQRSASPMPPQSPVPVSAAPPPLAPTPATAAATPIPAATPAPAPAPAPTLAPTPPPTLIPAPAPSPVPASSPSPTPPIASPVVQRRSPTPQSPTTQRQPSPIKAAVPSLVSNIKIDLVISYIQFCQFNLVNSILQIM